MSDQTLSAVYQWIPGPILALLFIFLVRNWLKGHEDKLTGIVARLELATNRVTAHDTAIDRLAMRLERHEQDCAKREKEHARMRERQHRMAEEIQLLNGRLEGSGPKRWPDPREDEE